MKLSLNPRNQPTVSDEEIERDVAELRRLLEGLPGESEPHPAYWQNFLLRVRSRIDDRGGRRRRWSPSIAWTTVTAAAVVVVLAVSGILPISAPRGSETTLAVEEHRVGEDVAARDAALAADPLAFEEHSARGIVLSQDDVTMLKAIVADDESAMLLAILDSEDF